VVSLGSVVVGTLMGVATAPLGVATRVVVVESAWAAPGEKVSSPTMATHPTNAAGATIRVRSTVRVRVAIYLRRKRQA
jgi:hypothetical protein